MKNGSVLNSPSATASAFTHNQNAGCLLYLTSLLEKFGDAVPTVYPFDLYFRLSMVDTLERLGITSHFLVEIQNVLEETYRCWVQRDEQIFKDVATCALAFRILRANGYQVSLDLLAEITKEWDYMYLLEEPLKDVYAALKVSSNISNEDYLKLAVEDFNTRQSNYHEELKGLERWNINVDTDCCSEEVRILFLAIKAEWLDLTKAMLREHIWARDSYVPTINEFVENGHVAVALGPIVLAALLLMTTNLSQEIIQSSEYQKLYKITSTHCRLLNDIRSVKRDIREGRLNVLTLHENYGKSGIAEEEVVKEIETSIDDQKKKLMQLVLEPSECIVLRTCKDAFWKMFILVSLFYATEDGVTGSNDIRDIVKQMIYEPVSR
nr:ent-kaur-16-ene synthase, chloroplastic-like [Tanacetum cinerariifolium]